MGRVYAFYLRSELKGVVPVGSGVPFYTNATSNPVTTVSLSAGQSQLLTFWVNATGRVGSIHEFFADANLTSQPVVSNTTARWDVVILSSSTCVPAAGQDWVVNAADNCYLYGKDYVVGNMSFINTGSFTIENTNLSSQKVTVPGGVSLVKKPPFRWVIYGV